MLYTKGYNCKIEYVKWSKNSCADVLSRVTHDAILLAEDSPSKLEINDNVYETGALNSNRFNPREYSGCTFPPTDRADLPTLTWIYDQIDFSYFWSTSHPDASYQVLSQLAFWLIRRSEK